MNFRTPVDCTLPTLRVHPSTRLMFMGSCFSTHIGGCFQKHFFQTLASPFGPSFNPASMARQLALWLETSLQARSGYEASLFQTVEGAWTSWLHDTTLSVSERDGCLDALLEAHEQIHSHLMGTDLLCLTFGTPHVYSFEGQVVANCHKQPSKWFAESDLSVHDIVRLWVPLLEGLHEKCPDMKVLFTVSPYRYASYGLHRNQLGKATLLLAVDELVRRYPEWCAYFPAYEIVLDELRDYRFYEADMLHPSQVAVDYIWERFSEAIFTDETKDFVRLATRLNQRIQHRPQNPRSETHRIFLCKTLTEMEDLWKKYPILAFAKEVQSLRKAIDEFEN